MEIFFLGVGEACDTAHGNSSSLITASNGTRILLDCGFSVPHQYFRIVEQPEELDCIWISHFHGDHYLGLPLLFLRLWQLGRTRSLSIIGQKGVDHKVRAALELAYPTFEKKLSFQFDFHLLHAQETISLAGMTWSAALTQHSQYNLGLRLEDGATKFYYSGDGRAGKHAKDLIQGCDFVVHESFSKVDTYPYHGSVTTTLQLAEELEMGQIALVHLDHTLRRTELPLIEQMVQAVPHALLPVAEDRMTF
ncbi:MAG: Ribonuclease BN, tRNA processing enzyme [Candidatus Electronema aureum]|uniref:Ribonuclease BN, tRNA processing enzyme n=1 Tax=Candidatus Electronema aureum TaxID=2005002 RepID=A0A521FZ24_9BACT|nr:MAG: Ribonuclease BN, tRNA processing enzyme [Candidatus Electronema aureum]